MYDEHIDILFYKISYVKYHFLKADSKIVFYPFKATTSLISGMCVFSSVSTPPFSVAVLDGHPLQEPFNTTVT